MGGRVVAHQGQKLPMNPQKLLDKRRARNLPMRVARDFMYWASDGKQPLLFHTVEKSQSTTPARPLYQFMAERYAVHQNMDTSTAQEQSCCDRN
jgi:hypothetical protein